MDTIEYVRLHILPFNSALLRTIIPPSILPNARNISYHEIATFPEKAYGYVELPIMDAEKIKKKLNGTILKGTKVRIEKARERKERVVEEAKAEGPERPKKERKQKRKRDELPGVDIGERHVKRGWTTPAKDIKKDLMVSNKSKFTTGPECLFKTNLPPNVASREKIAEAKPDKRKRKPGKEAVVHEFAKTTKYATFLRGSGLSNGTKTVAEFVEGKGWFDEEGNLVEGVKTKKKKAIPVPVVEMESSDLVEKNAEMLDEMEVDSDVEGKESSSDSGSADEDEDEHDLAKVEAIEKDSSSDSDSGSSHEDSDHKSIPRSSPIATKKATQQDSSSSDESSDEEPIAEAQVEKEDTPPSSDSSSEEDSLSEEDSSSDSSDDSGADSEFKKPQSAINTKLQNSTIPALSITIPDSLISTPVAPPVHPLEALYKKTESDTKNPPKAVPSFSFFSADNDDEEAQVGAHLQVPLTPYTQKDIEHRGLRSAAPTPDTAHPSRRFVWPSANDQDEDGGRVAGSPTRKSEAKGKEKEREKATEPESDFQKWFYENRGDVRRAWTGRRKSAAKEKRQRENRKRERRAV
ncbi:uncharacterized protein L3040_003385 [Drepanopeziza brunnea f. sp. 'multigermtubi']|uniref:Suppressor protein SRP40 n=1 Tax=Marssonina brunnea f. sp. multigermtubi (strain MB_m1) TaxID=1072389 RepID=K1W5M5_MARBU|nr:uncharacterized protein MBM_09684 [Drepanopeziza brunnea f. sp. 'multigermtubi' MB_m1]EKD12185.1 hypothetical protein MBM_09684 [Drepanopeziza brunnea f. sp. 'multigermtubi' MB_m1]KAJ5047562.1 hypothetical protein L3040_003385 [Drepanopeziza brunnea f. sp. 'multigermtubi']